MIIDQLGFGENWDVCLDEDELRVFYEYALELWQNGVDLADPYVQQVIEGNYLNIESACVVTLQYANKGHFMYEGKIDCEHATRFFVKALLEGWKPLDQV